MARFSLIPRETKFFDLFEAMAALLVTAASEMLNLLTYYDHVPTRVARIKNLEHEADEATHKIIAELHTTFVTPLDREDITLLAHSLDDIMDFIDGAANALSLYHIPQPTEQARELARILAAEIDEISQALPQLRRRSQMKGILDHCVEINRLENEADQVIRDALAELFDKGSSAADIIKWREIYEHLENAADRGEDVANVLEGIVLKHA